MNTKKNTKKILSILIVSIFLVVAGAIGFGKYKEYVDSKLLSKDIFKDTSGDGVADYAKDPLHELVNFSQKMKVSDEAKKVLRDSLVKVIPAIENLYTSDDIEKNTESVKIMRCFYRELSYIQKEFSLSIYDLMPLKKTWDDIQYPNSASRTFLQKKIGRIGVKAKISNKFCYENGMATHIRPAPKGLELNLLKAVKKSTFFFLK